MNKKTIPIFFAIDDNYAAALSVTLISLKQNISKNNQYRVIILSTKLSAENKELLSSIQEGNLTIEFNDVTEEMKKIETSLSLRDYYTLTTYFRFFISILYKDLNKALYLDSDLVITTDIAKLYNTRLGVNLLAAIPDDVIQIYAPFYNYVQTTLRIKKERYFNAGVLVMNLREFREQNIFEQFIKLSQIRKFPVAQDQDYLNVICKDRIVYLPHIWNRTAFKDVSNSTSVPNIIHLKLSYKPWHYSNIMYEDIFWDYAKYSPYEKELYRLRDSYTHEEKERDRLGAIKLFELCEKEIQESKDSEYNLEEDIFDGNMESGRVII